MPSQKLNGVYAQVSHLHTYTISLFFIHFFPNLFKKKKIKEKREERKVYFLTELRGPNPEQ